MSEPVLDPDIAIIDGNPASATAQDVTRTPSCGAERFQSSAHAMPETVVSGTQVSGSATPQAETGPSNTSLGLPLTVSEESRMDKELEEFQKASETQSLGLIVCKWFVILLLALIFVACLGASKLSAVHLSHTLNTTKEDGLSADDDAVARHSSVFLMLLISLMIPYAVTLLRCLWCGAFRSDRFRPSRSAVLWVSTYTLKE